MIESITPIIIVVLILVIIFFVSKLFFKALKIFIIVNICVFIIFLTLFIIIYKDANDLKNNLPNSESLLLFVDNDQILTGTIIKFASQEAPSYLKQEDLLAYSTYLQNEDYETLLNGHYKVMFIKSSILDDIEDLTILEQKLTKDELLTLLRSDDSIKLFSQRLPNPDLTEQLLKQQSNNNDFKGQIFAFIFSSQLEKHGPIFMLQQYKKSNIKIYPETIIFKTLKFIPNSLINKIYDKQ